MSDLATEDTEGADDLEVLDDDLVSFEGTSDPRNLDRAEWQTYRSDMSYIHSLMPEGAAVSFNHNDARQREFVRLRLKLAGKTPQNSPELFDRLAQLRDHHEATHLAVGTFAAVEMPKSSATALVNESPVLASGAGRKTVHEFLSVDHIPSGTTDPPGQQIIAVVLSLNGDEDPPIYTYGDAGGWSINWDQLAALQYGEWFGGLPYGVVQTMADLTLDPSGGDRVIADTYTFEDRLGGPPIERYMTRGRGKNVELDDPVVTVPDPNLPPGECYDICLNRNWTGDCDLDLTGTPGSLTIPMAGCVSLAQNSQGPYRFDQDEIDNRATNGCTGCGGVSVILQDTGGGCNTDGAGMINGDIQHFWSNVSLTNNDDTLCWDLTGANAMVFDSTCRQVQDSVTLAINVPLPVENNGGQPVAGPVFLNVTNDPADPDFPCITITNSCLAEGTMVELSEGEAPVPIESIVAGTMASNPFAASGGLTVMDVAKGVEDVPMVRIEDESGRTLLLTTKHPVMVPGRGMIQAEDLAVGDPVVTKSGPSRLTKIEREDFDGSVHNLKVGSDAEANALGADQTVFFANGFLVGDGQVQSKYESIEMAARNEVDLDTVLTPGWKRDYRNSARRARANSRASR